MLVWNVRPKLVFADVANVLVGMLFAGIVDEDVELAELAHRFFDRALAEVLVADVAGNRDRPAAFLLDDGLGEGGIIMLAQIDDGDVGAFAREQGGDRAADAAVGAGDQRDLVLEAVRTLVTRFPIGLGL